MDITVNTHTDGTHTLRVDGQWTGILEGRAARLVLELIARGAAQYQEGRYADDSSVTLKMYRDGRLVVGPVSEF